MDGLNDYLSGFNLDPDRQQVTWRRSSWERVWERSPALPGRSVLDRIDAEVNGPGAGTIRRSWVRQLADIDRIDFLAASTIWGYGNYLNRGVPALTSMLNTDNVGTIVGSIIDAVRESPQAGFSALFHKGRTRISRLGVSFGTKVVHFAGYHRTTPAPLVLDAQVYAAAKVLAPCAPVPNPARYTTGRNYQDYCEWAERVATQYGLSAEQVEYALFLHRGKGSSR